MNTFYRSFLASMLLLGSSTVFADIDRSVLPIKEPNPPLFDEIDVRKAPMPPHFEVKAPEGAPNIFLVLLDDLGFAGTSQFGGPIKTPSFEQIANEGVYYNNFHTTAVCSPTRAALKSGRNHHVNNMGSIIETGTGSPVIQVKSLKMSPLLRRHFASTATARLLLENGTKPQHGKPMP